MIDSQRTPHAPLLPVATDLLWPNVCRVLQGALLKNVVLIFVLPREMQSPQERSEMHTVDVVDFANTKTLEVQRCSETSVRDGVYFARTRSVRHTSSLC